MSHIPPTVESNSSLPLAADPFFLSPAMYDNLKPQRIPRAQIAMMATVLGMGMIGIPIVGQADVSEPRPLPQPRYVAAEGRVVVPGGIQRPVAPSGQPEVVASLNVSAGDSVREGDVLARFSSTTRLEKQLAIAQAEHAVATAALQKAQAATASKLAQLQAEIDLLERKDSDIAFLLDEHSPPRRERVEADMEQRTLRAHQAQVRAQMPSAENEAQAAEDLAQKQVAAAEAQISLAQLALQQAQLTAPTDGRILQIIAMPGESAAEGVVDLLPDTAPEVVAEVYITDRPYVREGAKVQISGEGFTQSWTGTVRRISPLVGRNTLREQDPLASVDRRVVETWIRLDEPAAAKDLIGNQVRVRIDRSSPTNND